MNAGDDINYDMTHDHAGNGWAIVQDLGDNHYRVASITKNGVDARVAFVACGTKLKRTTMLNDGLFSEQPLVGSVLKAVEEMRADLREGRKRVVEQRVVGVASR